MYGRIAGWILSAGSAELTVRLGILTGRGHVELIKEAFGDFWAWVSVVSLVIACTGAIVSEMSGIAAVRATLPVDIYNISPWCCPGWRIHKYSQMGIGADHQRFLTRRGDFRLVSFGVHTLMSTFLNATTNSDLISML